MSYKEYLITLAHGLQLTSVMNRTKWREVVDIVDSNEDFYPKTRFKYITGDYVGDFGGLDSELVKFGGNTRAIGWLEINAIHHEHVGWLVEPSRTNFSAWLRESLQSYSIPFTESEGIFRIDGYLRPAEKP